MLSICLLLILLSIAIMQIMAFHPHLIAKSKLALTSSPTSNHISHPRFPSKSALAMAIIGPVRYNTNDWIDCLWTWPTSRILRRTLPHISFFTLWTTFLTIIYHSKKITWSLPSTIHSILGSVLSLLLVFRTNSSYDRFWEGRKSWGQVIMSCREIATLTYTHIPTSYHLQIASLLVTFSIVFKQHIQSDRISSELLPYLSLKEIQKIQSYRNRPLFILRQLQELIHKALHEKYSNSMEATLHEHAFHEALHVLNSQVATCERIVKQPIPLAYSRHTSRFLSLYLFTLPFSMLTQLKWVTIFAVMAIGWSMVCIQEIGHFIEEPFNKKTQIIPLNQMTGVIRLDVSGKMLIFEINVIII